MGLRYLSVFAVTVMLGISGAMAQTEDRFADAVYEIKPLPTDVQVPVQPESNNHSTYYTRTVKCDGEDVAVLYKSFLGYSRGTNFVTACRVSEAGSAYKCTQDGSKLARVCHNKAIDFYGLQNRRAKIDILSDPKAMQDLNGEPTRAPLPAPAAQRNISR